MDDELQNVYISIDLDEKLVDEACENSLIITHHPLIFSGLKRVNYDSYSTKLLKKDFGYVSKTGVSYGVKQFINWYLSYYK